MSNTKSDCELCLKLEKIREGHFPFLIHEFKYTYWVLGDHQFFPGYSQIIYKDHIRDMHDLPKEMETLIFEDVMQASRATKAALTPWKMNQSCYGNAVPHIHWHLFPRLENEANCKAVPWVYINEFFTKPTKDTDFHATIKQLQSSL